MMAFILGAMIVFNATAVWFDTGFPVYFMRGCYWVAGKPFPEDPVTLDWQGFVQIKFGWLGELLTCPICLGTHLSWATGAMLCLVTGESWWLPVVGALTWPGAVSYLRRR